MNLTLYGTELIKPSLSEPIMSNDVLSPQQRSYCMSQIKAKNTKPETAIRKALWHFGYRYRIKSKLVGKPDLVFVSYKTVVFVDGCFWHKCPKHFVPPKTRARFWKDKINGNVARDKRNNDSLKLQGWRVIRIWEHEIKESLDDSVARIIAILKEQENHSTD